jgi:hypothetical protein
MIRVPEQGANQDSGEMESAYMQQLVTASIKFT